MEENFIAQICTLSAWTNCFTLSFNLYRIISLNIPLSFATFYLLLFEKRIKNEVKETLTNPCVHGSTDHPMYLQDTRYGQNRSDLGHYLGRIIGEFRHRYCTTGKTILPMASRTWNTNWLWFGFLEKAMFYYRFVLEFVFKKNLKSLCIMCAS